MPAVISTPNQTRAIREQQSTTNRRRPLQDMTSLAAASQSAVLLLLVHLAQNLRAGLVVEATPDLPHRSSTEVDGDH